MKITLTETESLNFLSEVFENKLGYLPEISIAQNKVARVARIDPNLLGSFCAKLVPILNSDNKKIPAIKLVREYTGMDLRSVKNFVEEYLVK